MSPLVRVPVLSNTTVVIFRVRSSTSTPLIRIPRLAPRPVPTMIATGVARPSAHGQATISTATPAISPLPGPPLSSHQPAKVASASAITVGTKTEEIRSARRCAWPLPAWAAETSDTIWASAVSEPTAVARTVSTPLVFTVAPATFAPIVLSTGTDSPVSIDSSTAEAPSMTSPSVGIFSPGRIRSRSPTRTASVGTITSTPSRRTRACLAPSSSSARIALPARRLARTSKYRPSTRNAISSAAVSKYHSRRPASTSTRENV